MTWGPREDGVKELVKVVAKDVTAGSHIHQFTAKFRDDPDHDDPSEGNISMPVGEVGYHAPRVLPCTGECLGDEFIGKVDTFEIILDITWIEPIVTGR